MSKTVKVAVGMLLVATLALSFTIGYNLGNRAFPAADGGLDRIEQTWNFLFNDYVDREKLSADNLSEAAIRGMLEALDDPYTSFLDAEHYELGLSGLEGELEGIGAQVGIRGEQLTVIAPIADSPAAKADVRAGDVILEIDGKPSAEMSLVEAVLNIRGPKGTAVKLLIVHQDETEPVVIEITRAKIELTSVNFEMKGDIAYIYMSHFSGRTGEELLPVIEGLSEKEAQGIILDLRSNPGGLLDEVIVVTSFFLYEGVAVNVVDNQGEREALEVKPGDVITDLPMVVLVDSFSASGSEVLAGALQDYGRAVIAGKKTFGKGSVNILRQLTDNSALYITTARWLTPNGRPIEGVGIEPDYELELEGEEAIQWAMDYLKGQNN